MFASLLMVLGLVTAGCITKEKTDNTPFSVEPLFVAENTTFPVAVPVLSPEEAKTANENALSFFTIDINDDGQIDIDRQCLYNEDFSSVKPSELSEDVLETKNWKFEKKTSDSFPVTIKTEEGLNIKSKTEFYYVFVMPLLEHTIYRYRLTCEAKGKGKIILGIKGRSIIKEFEHDSDTLSEYNIVLGNAKTFNRENIVPIFGVSGNLTIKSIRIFQEKINKDNVICVGTITEISEVPNPETSDYPDCFYTAKFELQEIIDGVSIPNTIQLVIPAFFNKQLTQLSNKVKPGKWMVSVKPFSLLTKEEQEIEQVDEIDSYQFESYYLNDAEIYTMPFQTVSPIPILGGVDYASPYEHPVNPPLSEEYQSISSNIIKEELDKVSRIVNQFHTNDEINRVNNDFQVQWNDTQQKYNSYSNTLIWAHEKESFFSLPKKFKLIHPKTINDDNLEALSEFNLFLKSQGIQLIIQIVPHYWDIAALVLNPDFIKYGDYQSAIIVKQLLEKGIEAHYVSDSIVNNAFSYERMFFYPEDHHPDEGTQDVLTSMLSERLGLYRDLFPADLDDNLYSSNEIEIQQGNKTFWPHNCDVANHTPGDYYTTFDYLYNGNPIKPSPTSKLIIMGNSFTRTPTWNHAYLNYLARKIHYVSDEMISSGVSCLTSTPQLLLTSLRNNLKGKVIAILPIGVEHLTGNYTFSNPKKINDILLSQKTVKLLDTFDFCTTENVSRFSPSVDLDHYVNKNIYKEYTSSLLLTKDKTITYEPHVAVPSNATISITVLPQAWQSPVLDVNGEKELIPTSHAPTFFTINRKIRNGEQTFKIKLDDSCSNETVLLIGSISIIED